jgi:hypothetical protein
MSIEHNNYCKQYYLSHKKERIAYFHNHYEQNKEYILARNRKYNLMHKRENSLNKMKYYRAHLLERAEYNITHTDYIKKKQREYVLSGKAKMTSKKYSLNHPEKRIEYQLKIKTDVLTYYGNGKCACVRCGYNDIRALSIDHINGNGANQRKNIEGAFCYNWLKTNNYPEGYQTLCMNCQFIKRKENKENRWRNGYEVKISAD